MTLEPTAKSDLQINLAQAAHQHQLGIKILLFVLAELLLVNLMIYTAAYHSAAPPATSGNFYMWGVGCVIFEVFLLAFLLIGLESPIKTRLTVAAILSFLFALTSLTGLSGIDKAFPTDVVISAILLIPMSGVVAGAPILATRFLTNYRVCRRQDRKNEYRPASIRTIMLATAAVALALVAAQQSLGRIGAMPIGNLQTESMQFVVGFWITLAVGSGCGALMLFGLREKNNLHQHCLLVGIGANVMIWLTLLLANYLIAFRFNLLVGASYFTISLVATLIHSYLLTYVLELLGYQMTNPRISEVSTISMEVTQTSE